MNRVATAAAGRAPHNIPASLLLAESRLLCGDAGGAIAVLGDLEMRATDDALLLQHVAQMFAQAGRHEDAHRCYLRASEIAPEDPRVLYNLASSQIAIGDLQAAERNFDEVIRFDPHDYDAYQNRSTLRKQTPGDNHTGEISKLLDSDRPNGAGEVQLCYALAKEFEDLGNHEESFAYLKRGAARRRQMMSYDVSADEQIMEEIRDRFDTGFLSGKAATDLGSECIFILGLPRSGTTLLDRIVSSHSRVESMGEINDFALCLTRLAGDTGKMRLLSRALELDMESLGAAYLASVASYGRSKPLFIDKTPANFLYIGLIRKALPRASILHLRRNPVDSCLAMYRTLFRMGYPFSYDLDDLARYYIAYHRLMEHWRALFPGAILDVDYEALVADQEFVSRQVIAHCGLVWETACLNFEQNRSPVATASAVQVRQPIHAASVGRWRRFAAELEPLVRKLKDAGVEV